MKSRLLWQQISFEKAANLVPRHLAESQLTDCRSADSYWPTHIGRQGL